jgi:DNA polymerase delta subunit 1
MLSDSVKKYENIDDTCKIYTKNMKGIEVDGFVHFEIINNSSELYDDGAKFKIVGIHDQGFIIEGNVHCKDKMNWGLAKDDISPRDIFEMTKQGPQEKGIIAKYCIQDCNLVHKLFQKIDVMTSFIEMAKLCSVPIQFLVLRGQTIKLTSYMALKCREKDVLMPLISKGGGDESLEGANVLDPKCGLYLDDPVACLDYSSLYPTCSITNNICMSSLVWRKTYDLKGKLIKVKGVQNENKEFIYDDLPGYQYVDIPRDDYEPGTKNVIGKIVCRWAQYPGDDKAIFPSILEELLKSRKATKKQMEKEADPFKKNILEKRQLSIKITANSLYGQSGSKISSFYDIDVAASITASGRILLDYAKNVIETVYQGPVETKYGVMHTAAEYVYGDTDSVFFKFNFTKDGKKLDGKTALELTIDLAQKAGELATSFLKKPHDLEYEKTFMPFCLLSKKRYVGMLYELDINSCKRKSMGIVLKRRDNANIVKDVYGGIIDILMKENDIDKSIAFLKSSLDDIVHEKVPVEKLIISKSIRSFYKNPKQIAHNVLSERIGVRDPGNKPAPGDRIPYIYIDNGSKLQGDKIETPSYIKERNLKIDYGYYITNQIMNPVLQLFSLVLYDMKEFKRRKVSFIQELETYKETLEPEKYTKKEQALKDKEVEKILFEPYLRINKNKKSNTKAITSFFKA